MTHFGWRERCDACRVPIPGQPRRLGAMVTIADAGGLRANRPQAKRALKVYNKSNSKRFKLKKIYKVNYVGFRKKYMTFSAEEDGSLEPTLFRGVVSRDDDRVLHCEVKEDDEITLCSYLIDSIRSSPRRRRRKNDIGDGSEANSGGAEHSEITGTAAAVQFMNFPPQA